jgi:hypothetical protein
LLAEGRILALVGAGLDRMTISLQQFGPSDHEARRAPMSFDRYYKGLPEGMRLINANDGRLILCCGDYAGDTSLGNISDNSLSELLCSERAQSTHQAMQRYRPIDPKCQQCFGGSNPLKTAVKIIFLTGMFKVLKPGPGKIVREIDLMRA